MNYFLIDNSEAEWGRLVDWRVASLQGKSLKFDYDYGCQRNSKIKSEEYSAYN